MTTDDAGMEEYIYLALYLSSIYWLKEGNHQLQRKQKVNSELKTFLDYLKNSQLHPARRLGNKALTISSATDW